MNQLTENQEEDLQGIAKLCYEWLKERKVGSLTFNFFKGGVANVMMNESLKFDPNRKKTGVEGG